MLNNNTSGHKEFLKSLNWQVIKLNNNTHNSNLFPKASIFYKKKCSFYSSLQKGNIMMTFKQERREVKALLLPMKRSAPGHPRIQGKRLNKLPLTTEHDSSVVQRKMDVYFRAPLVLLFIGLFTHFYLIPRPPAATSNSNNKSQLTIKSESTCLSGFKAFASSY